MDSPVFLRNICILVFIGVEIRFLNKGVQHECYYCCARPKPSPCFTLAVADEHWRVIDTQRLTRTQFERWFLNREVGLVVMEARGSAHHWGRWLNGLGIEVRLLPAQYIRAYVKRNKTDAADAAALLEATRASDRSVLRAAKPRARAKKSVACADGRWMYKPGATTTRRPVPLLISWRAFAMPR
jgi:hypothetical protein